MPAQPDDVADYYATPSPTSDLSRHAALLSGWGKTPADAGRTACNVVIHVAAVDRMRLKLPRDRWNGLDVRSAPRIVDEVLEIKNDPLAVSRRTADRMIGNCYHIALLTCALLRHIGIAARTRAGFASYLEPGRFTDHWVCEVRSGKRWQRFDPDGNVQFESDPGKQFLTGAEAWTKCRAGDADPEHFGFEDARGWWFIRNNVVRDFAALCKVELLPWDFWGLMVGQDADRPDDLIDELSNMCMDDTAWRKRDERFARDPMINPNGRVFVFRGGTTEVSLPAEW